MQLLLLLQHVRDGRLSRRRFICGLHRPLLAPWYRLVADGERLLLEHGRSVVCFRGAAVRVLLPALLPLLDGTRSVGEVVAAAGPAAAPAIEQALELLEQNGLLVPFLDPKGLADTVLRVLEDASLARRLREGARRYAVKELAMADYIAAYEALIARLTGA